jgi:hypothetical protein
MAQINPLSRKSKSFSDPIPNDPFELSSQSESEILIDTSGGTIILPGAMVEENRLKVDASAFLVGGLDFGTF